MQQVIVQGISLDEFFTKIEEASYKGKIRAIQEQQELSSGIDWNEYDKLMTVKDVAKMFNRHEDTVRRWFRAGVFGETVSVSNRPQVFTSKVKLRFERLRKQQI